jgi:uncharacterized protein YhaN
MEIPEDVRVVIELFEKQLAKVAFPELDAAVLRKHADEVQAEAAKVEKARAALEAALVASEQKLAALRETVKRAAAYARIYSDSHPEKEGLAAALAEMAAPLTSLPVTAAKKRGRPRKQDVQLFALPEETPANSLAV